MGILYLSLYLIALGTGGLKSSVSGFGTDQFDDQDKKEKTQKAYFFNSRIFLSGTKRYRYKKSLGSPIVHILQVVVAASRKRKMETPYDFGMLYENSPGDSRIHHTDQLRFLDKVAIVAEVDFERNASSPNPWRLCSVKRVEEVKMVARLLPVWATTIIFWTTYAHADDHFLSGTKHPPWKDQLERIAIGLTLSTVGMAAAALAETK
ncbi:hypothetical protein RHMOL_Rhmol01G0065600 [Rhododendron molle]|uniref:Uncharacterized protein n=1 Tax=Rhododendron molle TaxID=49168 RepID=A0ACC0Q1P2_RHOML|nr:hypothetical protein RHMOL_Rhmol01G0065600 [Rhododendron molle]